MGDKSLLRATFRSLTTPYSSAMACIPGNLRQQHTVSRPPRRTAPGNS
jgi:hypothetical protein